MGLLSAPRTTDSCRETSALCRVDETSILGDVLAAHLAEGAAEADQLQPYREAGAQQLHILMLRAHSPVRCHRTAH